MTSVVIEHYSFGSYSFSRGSTGQAGNSSIKYENLLETSK
jgi:hypothetical protein